MERGELDQDEDLYPHSYEEQTMEERLDELCVYYMSIGVPYDEFWYGDYCSLKYYEEVFLKQQKLQNQGFWMQGIYNYSGVATALGNAFRGKGQKAEEYMNEPISFYPKSQAEQEAENRRIIQRIKRNLNTLKEAWDHGRISGKDSEPTNRNNG